MARRSFNMSASTSRLNAAPLLPDKASILLPRSSTYIIEKLNNGHRTRLCAQNRTPQEYQYKNCAVTKSTGHNRKKPHAPKQAWSFPKPQANTRKMAPRTQDKTNVIMADACGHNKKPRRHWQKEWQVLLWQNLVLITKTNGADPRRKHKFCYGRGLRP